MAPKVDEESGNAEMPQEHALAIPVLANLSAQEQQELVQMAARFLQQKRPVALQGLELTCCKTPALPCCSVCRFLSLALSGWMASTRC